MSDPVARDPGETTGALVRLVDGESLDARSRAGALGRLATALGGSARRAGAAAVASGRWLTDLVVDLAPHVPARDLPTLREHYEGLSGDALAAALIDTATRATGAVGAAGGVLASVEFAAPPLLLSTPAQVAAETLAVVGIELKLVAELHEAYGRAVAGPPAVRAAAYLGAWTRRRGLDPFAARTGLSDAIGAAARRELRRRLVRRAGTNATTVLPFFTGAAAGASLNARETRRLAERIVRDLRR